VIANPPFGKAKRLGTGPRYTGSSFEYHLLDLASDIADHAAFIVAQGIAPFRFSGAPYYVETKPRHYHQFWNQTKIDLQAGCGINTTVHKNEWKQVIPTVEIVTADFMDARDARKPRALSAPQAIGAGVQGDLFGEAA